MKAFKTIVAILVPFIGIQISAQTPTNCFEIESILVDACGTPENGNEMVRFKVGPNPLDASLMVVDWPNNSFLGLIQDAQTATTTANINATITSCGHLIEPPAFILPAGASVLLITSQMVNVTANSFANLSDTLYVLYQNLPSPTTNGHFSNSASTPRTLIIDFTTPANCGDTVTYLGTSLIGGDGAIANFEYDGTVSYTNNGCQALIMPSGINITTPEPLVLCAGDAINLSANAFGNYSEIIWSGGTGTFSVNDVENTTYNSTTSDNADFYLYAGVRATCNDTILDSILVTIATPSTKTISPTSYDLCPGETLTLTASGGTSYLWSTTETTNTIDVSTAGTYDVTIDDGCYSETLSAIITNNGTAPNVSVSGNTDICVGESTTLSASGNGTITWNNNFTGNDFSTNIPDDYYAVATNGCGTDTAFVTVNDLGSAPSVTVSGDLFICDGISTTLSGISTDGTISWNNSLNADDFTTNIAGNYYAVATNICGTDTAFVEIVDNGYSPNVSISGNTDVCSGGSTTLTASGDGTITWNNSFAGNDFTTGFAGQYYAVATNTCGTDTAFVTVNNIGVFPTAIITGDLFVCDPLDEVSISVSGGDTYTWSNGSTNTTEEFTFGANYYVVATNNCGNDTLFFDIENESVIASFTPSTISGEAPLEVTFTDQSTNATSYSWNFGNGSTSNNENTSTTYLESGVYEVSLVVSNANACQDSTSVTITVEEIPEIIIPNIFTPNGDQSNDMFRVASNYIKNVKGAIYNRWGTLLYALENVAFFWDGSISNGEIASDGVYFYTLTVELTNGEIREFSGHVTLMR